MEDLAEKIMARTATEPLKQVTNAFILASIANSLEPQQAAVEAMDNALKTLCEILAVPLPDVSDRNYEKTYLNVIRGQKVLNVDTSTPYKTLLSIDRVVDSTAPSEPVAEPSIPSTTTAIAEPSITAALLAAAATSYAVAPSSAAAVTSTTSESAAAETTGAALLAAALVEDAAQLAVDSDLATELATLDIQNAKNAAALAELDAEIKNSIETVDRNAEALNMPLDQEVDELLKRQADENTLIDDMVRLAPYAGKDYYKKMLITGLKSTTDYNPSVLLANWNRYNDAEKVPILSFIKDPRKASLVFNRLKTQRGGRYTRRRALK